MISLVIERADLKWKLTEAKAHFSQVSTKTLFSEIDDGTDSCHRFVASMDDLHGQEADLRRQIKMFYSSSFYRDVRQQREQIALLTERCQKAKEKYLKLKAEVLKYLDPAIPRRESDVAKAEVMMKLMRRLDQLRLREIEQSERYVKLRKDQVKEVQSVTRLLRRGEPEVAEEVAPGEPSDPFHMATVLSSDWMSNSAVLPSGAEGNEEEEEEEEEEKVDADSWTGEAEQDDKDSQET
jgi:hypothetical protein